MDRISEDEGGISKDGKLVFTDGDPSPNGHMPSRITSRLLNIIVEELVNLVEKSGQSLNSNDTQQILKAVKKISELREFSGDSKIKKNSVSGDRIKTKSIENTKIKDNQITRDKLKDQDDYIEVSRDADLAIITTSGPISIPSSFKLEIYHNMFGLHIEGVISLSNDMVNAYSTKSAYGMVSFEIPNDIFQQSEFRNTGTALLKVTGGRYFPGAIHSIITFSNDKLVFSFNLSGYPQQGASKIREVSFSHSTFSIDPKLLPGIIL